MLASWTGLGYVSETESAQIKQTWEEAVVFDSDGMVAFGEYNSKIFEKAAEELSSLDKEGKNPEMQKLIQQARAVSELHRRNATKAAALTYKPNPLQVSEAGIGTAPEAFIIINKDRLDPKNEVGLMCAAYEETAHIASKLPQYPDVNRPWLEEALARNMAFRTKAAFPSKSQDIQKEAATTLRLDDYHPLIMCINKKNR